MSFVIDSSLIINQDLYKTIENECQCVICQQIVYDPMQCQNCQNCFCKVCIETWERQHLSCPFRCQNYKIIEAKLLKNILSKLLFKCVNGCNEEIPYSDLKEHLENKCDKLDFKQKYKDLLYEYKKLHLITYKKKEPKPYQFKSKLHKHVLAKCITYRSSDSSGWLCNLCRKNCNRYIPSYYCTLCDFDLCAECKEKEEKENKAKK